MQLTAKQVKALAKISDPKGRAICSNFIIHDGELFVTDSYALVSVRATCAEPTLPDCEFSTEVSKLVQSRDTLSICEDVRINGAFADNVHIQVTNELNVTGKKVK